MDAYRAHDPWAIYRSTGEWLELARQKGLVLQRIVALDRVPLHVAREARPACELNYPPEIAEDGALAVQTLYDLENRGDDSD